jgi:hypothetical protein
VVEAVAEEVVDEVDLWEIYQQSLVFWMVPALMRSRFLL